MIKILNKMNLLLDRKQKAQMGGIVIMMLIGGVLESVGVAMAIPVLQVIIDPTTIQTNRYMRAIYELFGMTSTFQFAITAMIGLILAFVVKNVFLFFLTKVELRFVYTNQFATSRRMMINFMQRPYEYYLGADTAVIQRSITSDVNNMYGLILSVLQLFSEYIVFACLVIVLLYMDAGMVVSITALLVVVLIAVKYILKPIMRKAGEDNQDYYSGLFKWIDQSVTGIKEIKIANREPYFINEYAKCGEGYVNAVQKYNLYNATPRLLIETVCVAGLVSYMMIQLISGAAVTTMLSQIAAFGVAAMRLLPSANRINNYQTAISYFEPFFMGVTDDLQSEIHDESIDYDAETYVRVENVEKLPVHNAIELKDIVYHYPDSEMYVFDHADMTIPVGKSVGIVGTSGAGKTTIVNIMLGLLDTESGQILADGVNVRDNYRSWLKNIGYIPQSIFMLDTSIRKNVAFGIPDDEIDDDKVWAALKEAQLDEYVRSLPEGLDTGIGERGIRLSGGQRQRIGIARALFEDPEVLVLDEATSALDNETETAIMDSINRLHGRKTLIIIAHRLQTIEKCDMVYRVENGHVSIER
ncbi:MAG: ABC transporter ATP-binding protein/permease [Lachnospiraceae bacterium]|nr:ABC transporter ATP-binding protein/permease [Lachnospiraceae bacterium]